MLHHTTPNHHTKPIRKKISPTVVVRPDLGKNFHAMVSCTLLPKGKIIGKYNNSNVVSVGHIETNVERTLPVKGTMAQYYDHPDDISFLVSIFQKEDKSSWLQIIEFDQKEKVESNVEISLDSIRRPDFALCSSAIILVSDGGIYRVEYHAKTEADIRKIKGISIGFRPTIELSKVCGDRVLVCGRDRFKFIDLESERVLFAGHSEEGEEGASFLASFINPIGTSVIILMATSIRIWSIDNEKESTGKEKRGSYSTFLESEDKSKFFKPLIIDVESCPSSVCFDQKKPCFLFVGFMNGDVTVYHITHGFKLWDVRVDNKHPSLKNKCLQNHNFMDMLKHRVRYMQVHEDLLYIAVQTGEFSVWDLTNRRQQLPIKTLSKSGKGVVVIQFSVVDGIIYAITEDNKELSVKSWQLTNIKKGKKKMPQSKSSNSLPTNVMRARVTENDKPSEYTSVRRFTVGDGSREQK